MTKNIEIDNNKIDFTSLYKIVRIDIDKITFKKYEIKKPVSSLIDDKKSIIELDKEIGEEIHVAKANVIEELAGKVGLLIKGFRVKLPTKRSKKVIVDSIEYIEPFQTELSYSSK